MSPNPPVHLRRSRRKGYRLPPGAIYVGRPTLWGNPFSVGRHGNHARCVILHKARLAGSLGALTLEKMGFSPSEIEALTRRRAHCLKRLHLLGGKDLACWCPLTSDWCHAETLLALASTHADYERHAA